MSIRQSTGLRNFLATIGCYKRAFEGGKMRWYSGTQPVSADSPMAGTLLAEFSLSKGTITNEVRSFGTVTLTGGASGSVSSITVNGVEVLGATVSYTSSLTLTAAAIAAQINAFQSVPKYEATSSGAVVTIKALPGTGTGPNTFAIVVTATTITHSEVAFSGGVAGVNGLTFGLTADGALQITGAWECDAIAGGTVGCYRLCGSEADANGTSTTLLRLDGSVGVSGADLPVASTAITLGAPQRLTSFTITVPAS